MLKFGSKHDSNIVYKCTVRFLEDTDVLECEYKPQHKGKYLLEYVCQLLNLAEQDYFGLRYVDNQDQRHWLDLGKSICKQVKDHEPVLFSFRVKFYPPDVFQLKEEITRYQIFLQLKRDLLHGRLYCSANDSALLAALIIQAELGDYNPDVHSGNYVSEFKILLKQTEAIEEKAMDIHQKQLKGQGQSQVENTFLRLTSSLDTYGVDPHPVKDHKGAQLYLGINHSGIMTFQGSRKTHHFRWSDIQKINYEGKMFIIHLNSNEKKHTVGFKCPSSQTCRHVWRCAIEQMLFFTLPTSSDASAVVIGGGFFSWGKKFKYTGRTEKEIMEESNSPSRDEPTSERPTNVRRKASSVPATPSTPLQPHLGYYSLPKSSYSDVGGSRMESSSSTGLLSGLDDYNLQSYSDVAALETVTEDHEALAMKLRTKVLRDDSMDCFSDYCFCDLFEHSSSESQLIDNNYRGYEPNPSHRSSRSQTPLSHSQVDRRIYLPNTTMSLQNNSNKFKKFNIISAFVPSLIIVIVIVLIFTIMILETDCSLLSNLRNIPEMVTFRYQIYKPMKEYFRSKITILF